MQSLGIRGKYQCVQLENKTHNILRGLTSSFGSSQHPQDCRSMRIDVASITAFFDCR
jgi:hypothetical protein